MTYGGETGAAPLIAANIMHFARLLRRAGLPVGPADMLAAQQAVGLVNIGSRLQVHTALRTTMVHRHEHVEIFDTAFQLFWRDPEAGRFAAALGLMEGQKERPPEKAPPGSRRLAEAMHNAPQRKEREEEREEVDAILTVSDRERLQTMDFEAMSADDIARAKQEISRPPPLVVLCDISGSMSRYAQILLHFLHAVANDRDRVHIFLFGTRLSNITRQLKHRDPEVAFQMVSHAVPDWSGGTRIGEALAMFNRTWSRRVLGQGAVVLLVTDGLDRDGAHGLAENMQRLHRSCRRLIWLNPLLRWDGFEPKSQGIRAMLPEVDEFRPVHNLASLRALVETLSRPLGAGAMDKWRLAA